MAAFSCGIECRKSHGSDATRRRERDTTQTWVDKLQNLAQRPSVSAATNLIAELTQLAAALTKFSEKQQQQYRYKG